MAKRIKSNRRSVTEPARLRIFLSASVPLPSRNAEYFSTADVLAIRDAVRALTIVVIEENIQLVFGGGIPLRLIPLSQVCLYVVGSLSAGGFCALAEPSRRIPVAVFL